MTKEQLLSLIPKKTMVWAIRDNVGYTFMGIDENGKYILCGKPVAYEDYLILNHYYIKE